MPARPTYDPPGYDLLKGPGTRTPRSWELPDDVTLSDDGEWLHLAYGNAGARVQLVPKRKRKLLDLFLDLADASAEKIRAFVEKYGALELGHQEDVLVIGDRPLETDRRGRGYVPNAGRGDEPVAAYRYYAQMMRSGRAVAWAIRNATDPNPRDVSVLEQRAEFLLAARKGSPVMAFDLGRPPRRGRNSEDRRSLYREAVEYAVEDMIAVGHMGLHCEWFPPSRAPQLTWAPYGLWTALVAEWIDSLRDIDSPGLCIECGRSLKRGRAAKFGQPNWCREEDCLRLRNRQYQQTHRAEARRAARAGARVPKVSRVISTAQKIHGVRPTRTTRAK